MKNLERNCEIMFVITNDNEFVNLDHVKSIYIVIGEDDEDVDAYGIFADYSANSLDRGSYEESILLSLYPTESECIKDYEKFKMAVASGSRLFIFKHQEEKED
jgi:hypothetical protein